jgi:hypothetical protein
MYIAVNTELSSTFTTKPMWNDLLQQSLHSTKSRDSDGTSGKKLRQN